MPQRSAPIADARACPQCGGPVLRAGRAKFCSSTCKDAHHAPARQARYRAVSAKPSESAIQAAVLSHWRACGRPHTLVAAIPNARAHGQAGLTKGLPDLLVLGGDIGVGFIELKREGGRVSDAQRGFGALCSHHMLHHRVTVGRDEPIAVLEQWGVVRRQATTSSSRPSLSQGETRT